MRSQVCIFLESVAGRFLFKVPSTDVTRNVSLSKRRVPLKRRKTHIDETHPRATSRRQRPFSTTFRKVPELGRIAQSQTFTEGMSRAPLLSLSQSLPKFVKSGLQSLGQVGPTLKSRMSQLSRAPKKVPQVGYEQHATKSPSSYQHLGIKGQDRLRSISLLHLWAIGV